MAEADSTKEIEVKFRVADRGVFEEKLRSLGAKEGPREFETNLLFDDAARSLAASGKVLRLRRTDGRGLLTLKGPKVVRDGVRSRLELETGVEEPDRMQAVLENIGYQPGFRYDKYRTVWNLPAFPEVEIVVDETPLGLFAEIEGPEEAIRNVATRLGASTADFIPDSYVALHLKARLLDPSLPANMVFV